MKFIEIFLLFEVDLPINVWIIGLEESMEGKDFIFFGGFLCIKRGYFMKLRVIFQILGVFLFIFKVQNDCCIALFTLIEVFNHELKYWLHPLSIPFQASFIKIEKCLFFYFFKIAFMPYLNKLDPPLLAYHFKKTSLYRCWHFLMKPQQMLSHLIS